VTLMSEEEVAPRAGGVVAKLLKPFLDHLRELHGPGSVEAVGDALQVNLNALVAQRGALVSSAFIERFCEEIARYDATPGMFFQVGQRSWSPEYMEDHWLVMKLGGTVQLAYEGLFHDFDLFNQAGTFEIDSRCPGHFNLRYVTRPGVARERVPHVCEARRGQLSAVPTIFDRPHATLVEHECMAQGAPHCRYELSFDATHEAPMSEAAQKVMLDIRAKVCQTLSRYVEQAEHLQEARREVERQVELRTRELSAAFQQLKEAHDEIHAFEKARNDFMLGVSHDVRSPLQVVLSACDLLRSATLFGEQERQMLDAASIHAQRIARLCSQLEELGMLRVGHRRSVPHPFLLQDVVDAVACAYSHLVRGNGQTLQVFHYGPSTPTVGLAARLDAALSNLINNAMRVTPPGGGIRIERWEDDGWLCLRVSDDGPGVPAHLREKIFSPFVKGDSSTMGHLGLGLAIVQSVMAEHKGEVSLVSEPGQGAAFILRFPRQRPSAEEARAAEHGPAAAQDEAPAPPRRTWPAPFAGAPRLLLVEDNATLGEGLGDLLGSLAQVRLVDTAEAALEVLDDEAPNLLLCDIGLPGVDGLELCRRARARFGPGLLIVILSARQATDLVLSAYEAGADDYITKPYLPQLLQAQIQARLRRQSALAA